MHLILVLKNVRENLGQVCKVLIRPVQQQAIGLCLNKAFYPPGAHTYTVPHTYTVVLPVESYSNSGEARNMK
jgi:hypothetical protein